MQLRKDLETGDYPGLSRVGGRGEKGFNRSHVCFTQGGRDSITRGAGRARGQAAGAAEMRPQAKACSSRQGCRAGRVLAERLRSGRCPANTWPPAWRC